MGKSITQQARGKGGPAFTMRKRAYIYKIGYPRLTSEGKAQIVKLINSLAHTAPLAKIRIGKEDFYSPATEGVYEGQEIYIGKREENKIVDGDILRLKDIPQGTKVFNIEISPGTGGKCLRSAGSSGIIMNRDAKGVEIIIRRRKLVINEDSRATVGVAAGDGRTMKPFVKAGNKHHLMLSKGRKWHRTSPIKTNAVDHPFGSGRGKRIKSKIAQRNAPPGAKVGHIRPKRTGHIK
ncbi:MAG: 50S ribosomal protein L2 [Candidatus Pacearchaeota archaeon]|jgi:large subunit ribosomal protein L2